MSRQQEMIWVNENFYSLVKPRIIRDKRERKTYQKLMPHIKYYDSFNSATKDIAEEMKKIWR